MEKFDAKKEQLHKINWTQFNNLNCTQFSLIFSNFSKIFDKIIIYKKYYYLKPASEQGHVNITCYYTYYFLTNSVVSVKSSVMFHINMSLLS